jgi:hypothetical protein
MPDNWMYGHHHPQGQMRLGDDREKLLNISMQLDVLSLANILTISANNKRG